MRLCTRACTVDQYFAALDNCIDLSSILRGGCDISAPVLTVTGMVAIRRSHCWKLSSMPHPPYTPTRQSCCCCRNLVACRSIVEIPGHLYTVNPIAVNSPMCNVFTENKRVRIAIRTQHFGVVQFVAIGATAVGSINLTVTSGEQIKKGDELGYFAFGGSTCITLINRKLVDLDVDLCKMSCKCAAVALSERSAYCLRQSCAAPTDSFSMHDEFKHKCLA